MKMPGKTALSYLYLVVTLINTFSTSFFPFTVVSFVIVYVKLCYYHNIEVYNMSYVYTYRENVEFQLLFIHAAKS